MATIRREMRRELADTASGTWWWFLVTGITWLLLAVIVLRFDMTSVATVGVLLGVVLLLAGLDEFFIMWMRGTGWRWVHALMGIVFVIGGVWAFIHPIGAFYELAAILGFVLVFKGGIDIASSAIARDVNELWGLGLFVGILEVLLGFWVSQQVFAPRAVLIITWVGMAALLRGIGDIVVAFEARRAGKELAAS
jgi:uncharacterized membrane protein HdeD (DUF308 family)